MENSHSLFSSSSPSETPSPYSNTPNRSRKGGSSISSSPYFLESCNYCKRHLTDGHDIYMYRGNIAFCSSECRKDQIAIDKTNEKNKLKLLKKSNKPASKSNKAIQVKTVTAAVAC